LPASTSVHATAIAALFAIGSWSSGVAERHFGTRDPAPVVIDEVMGMLVTLFLNPVGWAGAAGAFLLFRIADVIKPFPANRLEQLRGGIGVMADDAMAAVYANLALRAVLAFGNRVI
jgi:phosphatidylglycerophosphatase A